MLGQIWSRSLMTKRRVVPIALLSPEEAEARREKERERYCRKWSDPEYRSRVIARQRKYLNDPVAREKRRIAVREQQRRRRADPVRRAALNAKSRAKYAENPEPRRARVRENSSRYGVLGKTYKEPASYLVWKRRLSDPSSIFDHDDGVLEACQDWYDRWLESLDGGEPVW